MNSDAKFRELWTGHGWKSIRQALECFETLITLPLKLEPRGWWLKVICLGFKMKFV
jgi:hypothetical protein